MESTISSSSSRSISPSSSSSPNSPPPPASVTPVVVVSPCAACKILRRRCAEKCVLAPYFPPSDPIKFTTAHRVFGASNIIKFLQVCIFTILMNFCKFIQRKYGTPPQRWSRKLKFMNTEYQLSLSY